MSNNNGKELDDLYLKYFPLIPLLNLPSISASLWYPMISIQPSSKAFSLLLSPLIFLMCGAQRFIPAPLKTSGFSSRDASILFYFPSSPPGSLCLFLTFICLSYCLMPSRSLSFQRIFDNSLYSSVFLLFEFYNTFFFFTEIHKCTRIHFY